MKNLKLIWAYIKVVIVVFSLVVLYVMAYSYYVDNVLLEREVERLKTK